MSLFKLRHLFSFSLLVSALCPHPIQAMELNFDIDTPTPKTTATPHKDAIEQQSIAPQTVSSRSPGTDAHQPLPIPKAASTPPTRSPQAKQPSPHNVLASARILTPPPTEALPTTRVIAPTITPLVANSHPQRLSSQDDTIGLNFKAATINHTSQTDAMERTQPRLPQWIYEGGSNSLVARVIGSAEGTRTTSGQPTRAYYGHTDPGNGVWNMGTFSYQHGAASPHEADQKQLKRLQKQGQNIEHQANQANLSMSLGEVLNGLDLANQAPKAALDRGGYVDRLVQARQKGMNNEDAIIWARTYAYIDPDTQRWNAPGLGNTLPSIQRDQDRRHQAISQAFEHYVAHRDTHDNPPADSLQTPVLALASTPSPPPPQATEPPEDKQEQEHLTSPALAPVEFSMAEVPFQASPPVAKDSSQAQVVPEVDNVKIRS